MKRSDVVALYVDPRGPYPKLVEDFYDETRDARTYSGPLPVVAHPPCGPWGRLRHLSKHDDPIDALNAVAIVRVFGGVLEHPAHSKLWDVCGLPKPHELPDAWNGRTVRIDQVDFGHVARKATWLYIVTRKRIGSVCFPERREPTHWISGGRNRERNAYGGHRGYAPAHIKFCSEPQRRRTPPALAEWLCEVAARCAP